MANPFVIWPLMQTAKPALPCEPVKPLPLVSSPPPCVQRPLSLPRLWEPPARSPQQSPEPVDSHFPVSAVLLSPGRMLSCETRSPPVQATASKPLERQHRACPRSLHLQCAPFLLVAQTAC